MRCTGNSTCHSERTPHATGRITARATLLSYAAAHSTLSDETPRRNPSPSSSRKQVGTMTTYVAFSTAWPLRKSNAIALIVPWDAGDRCSEFQDVSALRTSGFSESCGMNEWPVPGSCDAASDPKVGLGPVSSPCPTKVRNFAATAFCAVRPFVVGAANGRSPPFVVMLPACVADPGQRVVNRWLPFSRCQPPSRRNETR